jgi:hypothetical protein
VKLGRSGPGIFQMLQQAYGEDALKRSSVFKWVQRYRDGRKDDTDSKRSGHPSTLRSYDNIDRVHSLALSDRQMTSNFSRWTSDWKIIRLLDFDGGFRNEKDMYQDCAKTAHSWAKVVKKTMLHWLEGLGGKGRVFGECHHRWWIMDLPKSTALLKGLKEDNFQGCFNQWKQRRDKCVASEGDKSEVPDNM